MSAATVNGRRTCLAFVTWVLRAALMALPVPATSAVPASESDGTTVRQAPVIVVSAPRPFAHHIGDVLDHRLAVDVPAGYTLQRHALPAVGQLNYWLELRAIRIDEPPPPAAAQRRYEVTLTYQIFYAPLDVRELTVPGFQMVFTSGDSTMMAAVPSWRFTMSPIMQIVSRGVGQQGGGQVFSMPDERPAMVATDAARRRTLLLLAALFAWGTWMAWRIGWWPGRSRAPFALALRAVQRLRDQGDAAGYHEALRRIHRAIDATHGRPLFADQLSEFLAQQPRFAPQATALERFFDRSRRVFFAGEQPASDLCSLFDELLALLHDCARRERRR